MRALSLPSENQRLLVEYEERHERSGDQKCRHQNEMQKRQKDRNERETPGAATELQGAQHPLAPRPFPQPKLSGQDGFPALETDRKAF